MASEQNQRNQRNQRNPDRTPNTTLSAFSLGSNDRDTKVTGEQRHLDPQKRAPPSYVAAAAATSRNTMSNASNKSQREPRVGPSTPRNNYQPRTLESLSLQEKAQIGLVPRGTTRAGQEFEWDMGARNLAGRTKIGVMDSPTQHEKQNYIFASPSTRRTEATSSIVKPTSIVKYEPPRPAIMIDPVYGGETRVFNINAPGDMKEGSNFERPPLGTVGQFRFQMPPKDPSTDFELPGSLGLPVPRNKKEMEDTINTIRARRGSEEDGGVSLKGYEGMAFAAMQREVLFQTPQPERTVPDIWRGSTAAMYQHAPTTGAEHEMSQTGQDAQMAIAGPRGMTPARSSSDWRAPGGPSRNRGFAAFQSVEARFRRLGR